MISVVEIGSCCVKFLYIEEKESNSSDFASSLFIRDIIIFYWVEDRFCFGSILSLDSQTLLLVYSSRTSSYDQLEGGNFKDMSKIRDNRQTLDTLV